MIHIQKVKKVQINMHDRYQLDGHFPLEVEARAFEVSLCLSSGALSPLLWLEEVSPVLTSSEEAWSLVEEGSVGVSKLTLYSSRMSPPLFHTEYFTVLRSNSGSNGYTCRGLVNNRVLTKEK